MKRLVVTADDFGLEKNLDRGIEAVCERGVVTHVSLVANGESVESAVGFLMKNPKVSAGIHLNLTDGRPLSGKKELKPLLGSNDYFKGSHWQAAWAIVRHDLMRPIEREYRVQLETVLASGVRLVQINTHGHLHVLPALFDLVARLAFEYNIPFVRCVEERPSLNLFFQSPLSWGKAQFLTAGFSTRGKQLRVKTNRCVGIYDSGRLNTQRFVSILQDLREGDSELICHPGKVQGLASCRYARWGYQWDEERTVLLSDQARDAVKNAGIRLVNFLELD